MSFRTGEVIDVFFPFRDQEGGKHRYVVVVSTSSHQERTGHVTGVGVFSDPPPARHEAYKVESIQGKIHGWIHVEDLMTVTMKGAKKFDEIKPPQLAKVLKQVRQNLAP